MSEFGKGLSYCLALFLCHSERERMLSPNSTIEEEMWFNGASDHLYDLEIPKTLPKSLQARLEMLKHKCLRWGHGFPVNKSTTRDKNWAIKEAKDLIRLIDKHFGVKTEKGDWQ